MSRPWISCNLAISADGKISSATHRPSTWTSDQDRARLRALRGPAQALLVGRGTLLRDRMTLTSPESTIPPLRCIVSHHGEIPAEHPIFHREGGEIHLLATKEPRCKAGLSLTLHHQSLEAFLNTLATRHGVRHIHCEGGGQLIASLAALDALDEIHLTWAGHTLFGGAQAPGLCGLPGTFLPSSLRYELRSLETSGSGSECFLSYRRTRDQ